MRISSKCGIWSPFLMLRVIKKIIRFMINCLRVNCETLLPGCFG